MATFSFTVVRKPIERKETKSIHSNVKTKGLSLVVNTTEEGLFFVTHEGKDYLISLDSYNCANTHEVYITKLHKGQIIRYSNPSSFIGNAINYIRFIPGNTVKGYIFKNPNTLQEEFYVQNVIFEIPCDIEIKKKFYANFKNIIKFLNVKLKVIRQHQYQ